MENNVLGGNKRILEVFFSGLCMEGEEGRGRIEVKSQSEKCGGEGGGDQVYGSGPSWGG